MLKLFLLLLTSVNIYKGQVDCDLNDDDAFRKTRGSLLYEGNTLGQYAHFNIGYYSRYKIVTNKSTKKEIGLYCKGTGIPENLPNDVKPPDMWVEIPLSKIATKSRVGMALLQQLDLNKTTIYASDLESYTTPCAIDGIAQGNIKDIKDIDDSVKILFEDAPKGTDSHTDVQLNSKKVTLSYDQDDLTVMKKLIWLRFVASFFNLEKYVDDKYDTMFTSYNCHKHNFGRIKEKKYIAITKYTDLGNDKGTWEILQNKYYNDLIQSAGGLLLNIEGLSNKFQDVQQFKNQIKYCDIIIDITEFPKDSPAELKSWKQLAKIDPSEEHGFNFLNQEKLFSITKLVNKNGNLDFEESGIVRPDLVIRDFIATQYPTYNSTYQMTWLANLCKLNQAKTLTKDQCAKPSYPSLSLGNDNGCKVYKNGIKKFVDDRIIQYENYELTGEDPIKKGIKNNSFGVGGILGITFGVLLLIGLSAFLAWWIKKRSITKGKPLTIHKLKAFKRSKESDERGLLHQDED